MSQSLQSLRTIGNTSTTLSANDRCVNLVNNLKNAVIGSGACTKNITGTENTVFGTSALSLSTGGSGIVAVGAYAAPLVGASDGAIFIGDRVAPALLSGFDSVVIGCSAGFNIISADGCVLIGPDSGTTLAGDGSITDVIGIGSKTAVSGLGAICLGASASSTGDGAISIGYNNIHSSLHGVTVGSFCNNTGADSIVIGCGLRASQSDSLKIVAGTGLGTINIQNLLMGGPSTTGGMDVRLATPTGTLLLGSARGTRVTGGMSADAIASPSVSVTSPTSAWKLALAPDSDLSLTSTNGTQVTFCDDFVPGVLNFTAQHRCVMSACTSLPPTPGSIVVATGSFEGLDGSLTPTIDEAIPVVALSSSARDPRVFGVVSRTETCTHSHRRTFRVGSMSFSIPRPLKETQGRVIVNSGGEGGILVCDSNGPIQNGDLITSSPVEGVGMRQGDDSVRAYTIAKATSACDFRAAPQGLALIGCVYMC